MTDTRSRSLERLTARAIETAKKPGYLVDGGGLLLKISSNGGKRWLFRFKSPLTNKRREMGLGRAGKGYVTLVEAREKSGIARRLVRDGIDPIRHSEQEATARKKEAEKEEPRTFGEFADQWMEENLGQFSNAKHRDQWRMTLTKYAGPLRAQSLDEITTTDVLNTLRPIWTKKPETAKRTQGRIERLLDAAKASGARTGDNPARWRGHLDTLLPKYEKLSRGHHAAMAWRDLPNFIVALRLRNGIAARALEFAILTAARSGEVRGATWGEINMDSDRWTVPASRMKAKREHRVPLSPRAREILNEMTLQRVIVVDEELIFPGAREGKKMSDMTLARVLKRMDIADATPHGFRSAFRDWAEDHADAPFGAIKSALAHTIGDRVDAAYRRGDAYDQRVQLMGAWADYMNSKASASDSKVADSES